MGCWNKTCGLTNLPIMSGEKTYVFVLERVKKINDNCYSTHLYRPLLLPFVSTYNDYGAGENSEGAALPVIMDALKELLVEIPQGENEYHDIAVSKDKWDEDLFFESIHEHRLRVNYRHDGETEVEFVMMRQDVVDNLLNSYEFEEYLREGKGTHGWKNSYMRYRFADLVLDIDPLLDSVIKIMEEMQWKWPRLDMVVFSHQQKQGDHNLAASWLGHDLGYRFSSIVQIRDHIVELLINGQRELARELLIDHLKGMFVNSFMEMTRKSWIPGGHEGSQSQEYEPYRALMAAMNRVMDERDARYAAENGEDEDDTE